MLAEKLQDTESKDKVLQAVIIVFQPCDGSVTTKLPTRGFVQIIYEGTPSGSLARKLLVHMYARRAKGKWLNPNNESNMNGWPSDFKDELLVAVMNERPVFGEGAFSAEEANKYKEHRAELSDNSTKA